VAFSPSAQQWKINQSNCLRWFHLITAICFGPYLGPPSGIFIKYVSRYWNIAIYCRPRVVLIIIIITHVIIIKIINIFKFQNLKNSLVVTMYFFYSEWGGVQTGFTRHVGHQLAYCTCPGWLWRSRIWWNGDWQGKPKYSEKPCPSDTSSTTNPTWPDRARTQVITM
jgi:hypothetical protein